MKQLAIRSYAGLFLTIILALTANGVVKADPTLFWNNSNASNKAVIDHDAWENILKQYLQTEHSSGVNMFRYKQVSTADKQALKTYLAGLQEIDIREYQRSEQMAYWINLYNALTIDLILDNYPVKSIKKVGKGFFSFGPWDDPIASIAGNTLTLNDIEHKILRPIWKDPRIHYAVNCASYGCPNLAASAYTASNTEALLNQGAVEYVNHPRGVSFKDGKLKVSSIFHWYAEDFGGDDKKRINHFIKYAKPELKQQLSNYQGSISHDYDWSLNAAK